jgi:hypothetical protein
MSLTSTMRPSPATKSSFSMRPREDVPFNQQPIYITLHRMLIRYQHNILLQPPSDTLTPFQEEVQRDLRSPLPYHRTKWLHNIEYARTLLLQLEHAAQGIKVQRLKKETIRDLAEKRTLIKRLRSRVEELGREGNVLSEEQWAASGTKETLEEILERPPLKEDLDISTKQHEAEQTSQSPISSMTEEDVPTTQHPPSTTTPDINPTSTATDRDALFSTRQRIKGPSSSPPDTSTATTSGFSNLDTTERILLSDSRTHEELTTSLVSMAVQLKQQARAFQGALDLDKGLLDRALEGLDKNVAGMAAAGQRMQFLRKMSEGQGWFGRMKLYAMIVGMWVVAILLVFVGPKLRF